MTGWREELEELDRDFAERRITIEEYRRRRDDLLARAAVTTGNGPLRAAWTSTNPATPPTAAPTAEAPVTPVASPPAPVAPPDPGSRPDAAPEPPPVPVPAVAPVPVAPPAAAPPWPRAAPALDAAFRTVGPSAPGTPGQEIFAKARPQRRTVPPKAVALVVVAVVVLGGAAWLAFSRNSTTVGAAKPVAPPAATATADSLPALPGTPGRDLTMAVHTGVDLGLYSAAEQDALARAGVAGVVYRSSASGGTGYAAVLAPTTSATLAASGVHALQAAELAAGEAPASAGLPATVSVSSGVVAGRPRYSAVYRSGSAIVFATVTGAAGTDPATLAPGLAAMVNTVLHKLPAS